MGALRVVDYEPAHNDDDLRRIFLQAHNEHPRTQAIYRCALGSFYAATGKVLRGVEVEDLQKWVRGLYEKGQAPSYVRLQYRVICAYFRLARELGAQRGGLDSIPPLGAVDLRAVGDSIAVRLITMEQWQAMLATANERERLILQLFYYTAMRRSELVGLRWGALRAIGDAGQALLPPGKGGRARAVGIPARLWAELQQHRGADLDSVTGLSEDGLYRLVKRLGAVTGIPDVSPHWIRHAFCTHAREAGAGWDDICAQAGHSTPTVTQRFYAHLTHEVTAADILEGKTDEHTAG